MSFLDRIRFANQHDLSGFLPFRVAGHRVGFVKRDFAVQLLSWPEVFRVDQRGVGLAPAFDEPPATAEARSAAVGEVLSSLRDTGLIDGWRDEPYAVNRCFTEPPFLWMERAAVPFFGVCGYGIHMNGFVRRGNEIAMWVGKRALHKPTGPGKLDQLVAGGQPAGMGLAENVIKECEEEAGIAPELAARAIPVGAISYCLQTHQGLRPDVIFCFDLELPADFEPVNTDGEVEEFYLWPIDKVIATVRDSDEFKFNCALVVIDFLVRRGFISPEHPDYMEIVSGLTAREPVLRAFDRGDT